LAGDDAARHLRLDLVTNRPEGPVKSPTTIPPPHARADAAARVVTPALPTEAASFDLADFAPGARDAFVAIRGRHGGLVPRVDVCSLKA
jgi:hypothetical protein